MAAFAAAFDPSLYVSTATRYIFSRSFCLPSRRKSCYPVFRLVLAAAPGVPEELKLTSQTGVADDKYTTSICMQKLADARWHMYITNTEMTKQANVVITAGNKIK